MTIDVYHRHLCRLCDSNQLNTALSLKPTPLEDDYFHEEQSYKTLNRYPLDVMLCRACGHAQLSHVIAASSIYDHYIYHTSNSPGLTEHFDKACDYIIEKTALSKSSLVVDIGCNDAVFLKAFYRKHMRVVGVEPSSIANKVNEKDIAVYQSYFNDGIAQSILDKYGSATLITANNVFANVDDLNAFVVAVKKLMTSESVFIIETGYWKLLVENGVFDFIYHEHLSYFTIKPLQQFFLKHGLCIYDAESVDTKGGSIRLYIQLKNGSHTITQRLCQLTLAEETSGIFDKSIYREFYHKLELAKLACHDLIDSLGSSKKQIAGYGASTSVTTLLHLFELGDRIEFLVDDNPVKHNTVSPGYHLPVYPASAIYDHDIHYALILPWRFAENIILKNDAFLQKGGRFVEVYPKPKIAEYLL